MTQQDITDFLEYCSIHASASTLKKIRIKITTINEFYKGKVNELELKDIHSFMADLNRRKLAPATGNDYKTIFKRFLRWKYKDWFMRFDEFKDLKGKSNAQRKLSKDDLLTDDEIALIISHEDSMKYKTLFLLLSESAGRPEELLKLQWKNINGRDVKLHSSKTGKIRTITLDKSIAHLKRYKEECFLSTPKADDIIFNLGSQALIQRLWKIEKDLKFHKRLYPYLFRHTTLTKMIKKLSPPAYEMFAGHSLEMGNKVYAHLDNSDLKKELDEKVYHIEELDDNKKHELEIKVEKQAKELQKFKEQNSKILKLFAKSIQKLSDAEKPKNVKLGNQTYKTLPKTSELMTDFNKI